MSLDHKNMISVEKYKYLGIIPDKQDNNQKIRNRLNKIRSNNRSLNYIL